MSLDSFADTTENEQLRKWYLHFNSEFHQSYPLPFFHQLKMVNGRKHLHVSQIIAAGEDWSGLPLGSDERLQLFRQHISLLNAGMQMHLLPKLSRCLKSPPQYFYCFAPISRTKELDAFFVTAFPQPVCAPSITALAKEDDRLGKIISRKIRDAYGRGPIKLCFLRMADNYAIIEQEGLLPAFTQQFILRSAKQQSCFAELFDFLIYQVLSELFNEERKTRLDHCRNHFDWKNNRIITLAFTEHTK